MSVDPANITRDYTDDELEDLAVFCICVAGKTAKTIAERVNKMSKNCQTLHGYTIFEFIKRNPMGLPIYLKNIGIGCYSQKAKSLINLVDKFPTGAIIREASVEQLEQVYGIGPKTSRFFVMCHKKGVEYAALDTHILKFLNANGIRAPKTTPVGKTYRDLEKKFLKMVPKPFTPAEYDLIIWRKYAKVL